MAATGGTAAVGVTATAGAAASGPTGVGAAMAGEAAAGAADLVNNVARDLTKLAGPGGPVTWRAIDPLITTIVPERGLPVNRHEYSHQASARIRARFTDPAALASFLASWAPHRDVHPAGVGWEVSDGHLSELEEDALHHAVSDAFRRARTVATAAGAVDVEALGFSDPMLTHAPHPVSLAMAMEDGTSGPAPIIPDDVEGTVVIEGRFRAIHAGRNGYAAASQGIDGYDRGRADRIDGAAPRRAF